MFLHFLLGLTHNIFEKFVKIFVKKSGGHSGESLVKRNYQKKFR